MKYTITVGDFGNYLVKGCEFACCDLDEVLETLGELILLRLEDCTLLIGNNLLRKAEWSENGQPYGEYISSEVVVNEVNNVLSSVGLINNWLKITVL